MPRTEKPSPKDTKAASRNTGNGKSAANEKAQKPAKSVAASGGKAQAPEKGRKTSR